LGIDRQVKSDTCIQVGLVCILGDKGSVFGHFSLLPLRPVVQELRVLYHLALTLEAIHV